MKKKESNPPPPYPIRRPPPPPAPPWDKKMTTVQSNERPRFPVDWERLHDDLMSNCDHEVNRDVAEKLKSGEFTAAYPGWNFHAMCWYQDGKFHARVMCYGFMHGIYSGETPEALMQTISGIYGQQ